MLWKWSSGLEADMGTTYTNNIVIQKAFYQLSGKESMVLGCPSVALYSHQVLCKLVSWLKNLNGQTRPARWPCVMAYGSSLSLVLKWSHVLGWHGPLVYFSIRCWLAYQTQHIDLIQYSFIIYTLQHDSSVQISHQQVDGGYTERNTREKLRLNILYLRNSVTWLCISFNLIVPIFWIILL
jgi:hypothetical protein